MKTIFFKSRRICILLYEPIESTIGHNPSYFCLENLDQMAPKLIRHAKTVIYVPNTSTCIITNTYSKDTFPTGQIEFRLCASGEMR